MEKSEDNDEIIGSKPKPLIVIMRLVGGEDIICEIFNVELGVFGNRTYTIANPMSIVFIEQRNGKQVLQLNTWMSLLLVKKSLFELGDKDIITMVEPSEDFLKHYTTTIDEMLKLLHEAKATAKKAREAGANNTSLLEFADADNVVQFKSNNKTVLH